MRWRVTITADPGQVPRPPGGRGPGRLSGRHLLDQSYRKAVVERGVDDLQQESRGRALARVYDHHHRAHLFRSGTRISLGRLVDLEDVTNRDSVTPALVDE